KRDKALPEHVQAAVSAMRQLNRRTSEVAVKLRVHAMTDVTGFGLVGHASEVARASHLSLQIDSTKLPLLPGTLDYSCEGFCAGGLTSNETYFGPHVSITDSVSPELRNVLFDPQTSGGLLVFCHPDDADLLVRQLAAEAITAVDIGSTTSPQDHMLT